ncbi:MAG: hypothetical protein Q9180_006672 [Flavoplaca navasiana]
MSIDSLQDPIKVSHRPHYLGNGLRIVVQRRVVRRMYITASVRNSPWINVKLRMFPRQYNAIESWVRPPLLLVINRSPSRYNSGSSSRPLEPLPIIEDPEEASLPPLFGNQTSLPVEDVLPDLPDTFFHLYADNFCLLNRSNLDYLLSGGECSTFLICSMAAFHGSSFISLFYVDVHRNGTENGSRN